jgi:GH25 family lysozyme M1 (1,4-beta-N-acetylmuramidase)
MSKRTLGMDVSFYQDYNGSPQQIDFAKAKANGIEFVFIREGQNNFPDSDLEYNKFESKKAGLIRGFYHFMDYR